jgi:protein SCO1/2
MGLLSPIAGNPQPKAARANSAVDLRRVANRFSAVQSQPSSRAVSFAVWGGLGLVALAIVLAYVRERRLNAVAGPLPVLSEVKVLQLTNQLGAPVTLDQLRGQVWIADIIFTRCPGPCATMTRQMAELQSLIPPALPVKLVSLTTDPEFDTPEVMGRYAERFGADGTRWQFLTGSKSALGATAVDGLKLTAMEKPAEQRTDADDLFIHSTIFAVVDKRGRLRAVVETQPREADEESGGVQPGTEDVWMKSRERLLAIVKTLAAEK